jgi:two-component system nitrogen regulation sensor histidine kinase NtrY
MFTLDQKKKKKRLTWVIIILCALLIPLLAYLQSSLLEGVVALPLPSTILVFVLININGLLLLLMLYLILRNLVELIFERKQNILGSRLRTRLVISFIALSLIPTALLFMISLRFVTASMDYWFNANVENSLQSALKLAQSFYLDTEKRVENMGSRIAIVLRDFEIRTENIEEIHNFLARELTGNSLAVPDGLSIIDSSGNELITVAGERLFAHTTPPLLGETLRQVQKNKTSAVKTKITTANIPAGELIRAITPLHQPVDDSRQFFLVTTLLIPADKLILMKTVSEGVTDYSQLIMFKAPIKFNLIIMLLVTTLLIIFGAIWFGFYIARSLTVPIGKLALATRRVSAGDLEFTIEKESDDEMGLLVDSFNSMTTRLLAGNRKLALANQEIQKSKTISEQRRQYLETILKNVAAGVIAIDEGGTITTINRFARGLLQIDSDDFLGHDFKKVLARSHIMILTNFLAELQSSGKDSIERHMRLTIRPGKQLSLLINITIMVDDEQHPIGHVIVFDNLTNLEKAQRIAAWQEVARRVAHEIKNPLTPIQLSAQRLRKRYMGKIKDDKDIFDQCTATIITQVDEIKKLVSEFSDFARMPRVSKKMGNMAAMIQETLVLYSEAHKHISFLTELAEDIGQFKFDPVQVKRVLVNLLDNGISVLHEGGEIKISLYKKDNRIFMTVADNGTGISDNIKTRIFEPYFSTRKSGSGLGLAIAHTIVSEHDGRITVKDNFPIGSVFIVELPFVTEDE